MMYKPVTCKVCKKTVPFSDAVISGWDWFTGCNKFTTYFCKDDLESNYRLFRRLLDESMVKQPHSINNRTGRDCNER